MTVSDNGVGMTREDLTAGLGTIARSGTKAFLDKLAAEDAKTEAQALIGQFGIGFYSAFMVADEVVVETRRAGAEEAWRWSSDGQGSFTIAPFALDAAPTRGTRVTLHLNPESQEFLDTWRVERIIRDHSGAVAVPVELIEKPGAEPKRVSDGAAIWAKPKSEVKPEDYTEFYRGLSGQFDEPALTVALAGRRAARIYRARLHPRLAAVRPVRSGPQGSQQALCAAGADHRGRRHPAAAGCASSASSSTAPTCRSTSRAR